MKRAVLFAAVAVLAVGGLGAADDAAVAVIKKGIEAHGGEEALKKAKGGEYKVEGEATIGAEKSKFTSSVSYALPDKFRTSVETTYGGTKTTQVIVINADKVKATSNGMPSALSSRPASFASSMPWAERSTSIHPVNRFSRFQMLWPWRSSTSLPVLMLVVRAGWTGFL